MVRAGLVRTFVQVPEVERVTLLIDGDPLKRFQRTRDRNDDGGQLSGKFRKEIYQYQYATLTLYFANEAGDHLVKGDAAGAVQHEHSAGACRGGAADEGTERRRPLCGAAGYDECLKVSRHPIGLPM